MIRCLGTLLLCAGLLAPASALLAQEEENPEVNDMLRRAQEYYGQQLEIYEELGLAEDQEQLDRSREELRAIDTDEMVRSYREAFDDQQTVEFVDPPSSQ